MMNSQRHTIAVTPATYKAATIYRAKLALELGMRVSLDAAVMHALRAAKAARAGKGQP